MDGDASPRYNVVAAATRIVSHIKNISNIYVILLFCLMDVMHFTVLKKYILNKY